MKCTKGLKYLSKQLKTNIKNVYTNATKAVDIRPFFLYPIRSLFFLQLVYALMCISVVQMCFGVMCLYCSKVRLTYVGIFTSYLSFCFVLIKHSQKLCKITFANTKYRNDNQIHIQIRIFNHISLVI